MEGELNESFQMNEWPTAMLPVVVGWGWGQTQCVCVCRPFLGTCGVGVGGGNKGRWGGGGSVCGGRAGKGREQNQALGQQVGWERGQGGVRTG